MPKAPPSPTPLPTDHPSLTLHLSDPASHTLVHSGPSDGPSAQTLATLASTLQTAHETASRLDLGGLQRVTVQTADSRGGSISQAYVASGLERGKGGAAAGEDDECDELVESGAEPPVLLVTVVAGERALAGEARKAVGELVELGKGLQEEWVREQKEEVSNGLLDGENNGGGRSLGSTK
ncbi:MAG: hypothetical protein M1814_002629 [Vezdaea aestivalis]|nr:MAG: hypothetical protein M1814_002629 [Vezdaea aestivalis]